MRFSRKLDDVTTALREARLAAGNPSTRELCERVASLRAGRGQPPEAQVVRRTTMDAAFSPGRRYLDVELVQDLAMVLGLDPDRARQLAQRCQAANDRYPVRLPRWPGAS